MIEPARDFACRLDRLAQIAVHVGLRVVPGQEVVITAPMEAMPLVRRVTRHAYTSGASLVTCILSDDETTVARYAHATDDALDASAKWLYDGMAEAFRNGAARLGISGENPSLLAGQDKERVARAAKSRSVASRPMIQVATGGASNWSIVSYATAAWAEAVFPDLGEAEAVSNLWEAIFAASRVDAADPAAAWADHNEGLMRRREMLDAKSYRSLHFRGPGTDLVVGLADGHRWMGGESTTTKGIRHNPNIPTEEVFTCPHRLRVDGHASSTKPLSLQGNLVRGIRVLFEAGAIVRADAEAGADVLNSLIETDDNSRRLGEVALVPHSSPISASGLLFSNTLYDENAASHIAIGQSYAKTVHGGTGMDAGALLAAGANSSAVHVDWMIGSGEVDVDGVSADGSVQPVMRGGEWA